jgi:tRNA-uridine 2-sulfurtransferase
MKTVLVAMSGGVDSSTSAALLKEQGYCVKGVFFRLHNYYKESEERALVVSKKLGIEFCVFDYQKEFKEKVIDYFLKANKEGLTPNPCVLCNKVVKFDLLFESLKKVKADYLATGHYARVKNSRLFKAKDAQKDQSYFLWRLNEKILSKTLFPMGEYKKTEVRQLAKKFNLPVWNQEESQEICFIDTEITEFLRKHFGKNPGKIIDDKDEIVGEHQGLWFYTIGQRKGIRLSGGPYYVIKKDIQNNILIVSKNKKDLLGKELNFKETNWVSGGEPKFPIGVEAKIRSMHKPATAVLKNNNYLIFDKPQEAITLGQSVVFYVGDELIGGGVISF